MITYINSVERAAGIVMVIIMSSLGGDNGDGKDGECTSDGETGDDGDGEGGECRGGEGDRLTRGST